MTAGPILVVDDDPAIRTTITDILEFEGYSFATASNGAEALKILEHTRPSLVLLDMRMPVMDGWGFASNLRSQGIELPIVVMTAAQDAQRWAREIGASACLAKPFDLMDLLNMLQQVGT